MRGQRWHVALVQPQGYVHSQALTECAECFLHGLRALGCDARFGSPFEACDRSLIFGAHLLASSTELPASSVLYNLEQLGAWGDEAQRHNYLTLLSRHAVWDYNDANVAYLKARGHARVQRVALGYVPEITRIPRVAQDIDVLFYGSVNERRKQVIDALTARGLKVHAVFGAYGQPRDQLIARAKLVLNLHYHALGLFEIARVSYLLANRKAVVCEHSVMNDDDLSLRAGMAYVPYDELVNTCVRLVGDAAQRQRLEERGFALFAARRQVDILRRLLSDESAAPVAFA